MAQFAEKRPLLTFGLYSADFSKWRKALDPGRFAVYT
jgi:hypothetical protein